MNRRAPDVATHFEDDIRVAAMCLVPVLITAPPDDALPIVQTIAAHERRGRIREIVSCDAAAGGDVIEAITDNRMRIGTEAVYRVWWCAFVRLWRCSAHHGSRM